MDKISITELKLGREHTFKQLVNIYKNKVINTCYGFVHNLDDAEDIAQNVFIEIYESVQNFKEDSSLSTWIYRIAVNKSLDFIRKTNRKKRWSQLTRINLEQKNEVDHWFIDKETPHLMLEQKERINILNAAINNLPANQKIAFTMHKYEKLSHKEIAEILNTSISSIESLMHRAKLNLRKKLSNYYFEQNN